MHRNKSRKTNATNKTSPVYAKLFSWKEAQFIIQSYKKSNISNKTQIYVDQMYSPKLTARRNEAMILRKELKLKNEITAGFIQYPATLMGKINGDSNFKKIKEF